MLLAKAVELTTPGDISFLMGRAGQAALQLHLLKATGGGQDQMRQDLLQARTVVTAETWRLLPQLWAKCAVLYMSTTCV